MKRKKIVCLLVISMLCIGGCGDKNQKKEEEADFSAISSVCELATLNVIIIMWQNQRPKPVDYLSGLGKVIRKSGLNTAELWSLELT